MSSKVHELLTKLTSLNQESQEAAIAKLNAMRLKRVHKALNLKGYQEELSILPDRVGSKLELTKKELIEQKAFEYEAILTSSDVKPLVDKVESTNVASEVIEKPLNQRQLNYRKNKLKREALNTRLEALAPKIIANLTRSTYTKSGKLKPLSQFERALKKELLAYVDMGVVLPFALRVEDDPAFKAQKAAYNTLNTERDIEDLSEAIDALNPEDRAALESVAFRLLNRNQAIAKEKDQKEKGEQE